MYSGCMDGIHADGSCMVAVEAISVVGDPEMNVSQSGLRDPSPKSPWVEGIKFERGVSLVNPLYEW